MEHDSAEKLAKLEASLKQFCELYQNLFVLSKGGMAYAWMIYRMEHLGLWRGMDVSNMKIGQEMVE